MPRRHARFNERFERNRPIRDGQVRDFSPAGDFSLFEAKVRPAAGGWAVESDLLGRESGRRVQSWAAPHSVRDTVSLSIAGDLVLD